MIHEHQFQRRSRSAPRQHFSGGHVGHGRLEPLVEAPSFKREAWVAGFVIVTLVLIISGVWQA